MTPEERAFEAAHLHPACTLEYRRLKKQKMFQVIFKNKPGTPPFLYKAKGKTVTEAMEKATNLFIGVARKAAKEADLKKTLEAAATVELPEDPMEQEAVSASAGD
jgi:hypothetical protein